MIVAFSLVFILIALPVYMHFLIEWVGSFWPPYASSYHFETIVNSAFFNWDKAKALKLLAQLRNGGYE
jgi:hypothetical protein